MPPEKRRPIAADYALSALANQHHYHPKAMEQIRRGLISSRKFVLDEEAARLIAKVVLEIPDLIVREHQFARPPFEVTSIEYPSWAFWETLRGDNPVIYDAAGEWGSLDTADHTVCYLFDHGRVNTFAHGKLGEPNAGTMLTPLQYRLHTEWSLDDQLEFARRSGCSRVGLDAAMWGSSYTKLSQDDRRLLRAHNVIETVPFNPKLPQLQKAMDDGGIEMSVRGAIGDLRTIMAILLMLNRPSLTRYDQSLGHVRGFIGNKLRPYMAHTTVKISLDPVPLLRLVGTPQDDGTPKRRYEVRGHYCHDQTARDYMRIAGCIHDWHPTHKDWTPWPAAHLDEADNWVCAVCEGKRWWRKEHTRGDSLVGYVEHDAYEVSNSAS